MCALEIRINDNGAVVNKESDPSDKDDSVEISADKTRTLSDEETSINNVIVDVDDEEVCKLSLTNANFAKVANGNADGTFLIDDNAESEMKIGKSKAKRRNIKHYYKHQLRLLDSYKQDSTFSEKFLEDEKAALVQFADDDHQSKTDRLLSSVTLFVNFCLFVGKIVAASLSGSLVFISSVIDSAMDLTTGAVIFCTNRAIKKRDITKYPRGRSRLEPLALIIISVVMGAANVQIIVKSIELIVTNRVDPHVEIASLVIMISTVVIKFGLMIACYFFPSPNARILAQDHRNDCISNTVAVVFGYLATKYWAYLDPIAAIVVSVYIIGTWVKTGIEHIAILSGKTADPEMINRIVKVCMDHKPRVDLIDTVYAYHFGLKYLVEVDVVLDEHMTLRESHDIAEALQRKLEFLPFIERAFVHVDYETQHKPYYEHKLV